MIAIRKTRDVDYADMVRRSPVGHLPKALEIVREFAERSTDTFVGYSNGRPACMYGVVLPSLLSNSVYLWLLTTDLVDEHKFLFVRHSQLVLEDLLKEHESIIGDCQVGDVRAQRWLKWLGGKFTRPKNDKTLPFFISRESFEARRWTQSQEL